jgi:hypothetical protein
MPRVGRQQGPQQLCNQLLMAWEGEYEGNCELPEHDEGDHYDGDHWFSNDGQEFTDHLHVV